MQRDGLIRINLNKLIEKTSLSFSEPDSVCRRIYIKSVDLKLESSKTSDDLALKKLPIPGTPQDLCNFYVMPARHQAYSSFWLYTSGLIVVGNLAVWFYF